MNVLVTGGAGFIGSHLVDRLLDDGHRVTVLDFFTHGKDEHRNPRKQKRKLELHSANIANEKEVKREYFQGIDWVFHLAGRSEIVPSVAHPLEYHRVNVDGTLNVLEASRSARVKRFVYAASSSCYGIPDSYPTPETAPIRPQYPYAATKYIGEYYALHWASVYKLPVVSLRLFNVYGLRSRITGDYGPVFSTFLAQKLSGKPFTVVGDGTQSRDFVFVTDVVEAFIMAAKSNVSGEPFNVGTGKTYSIHRLVQLLGGDVTYIPKRPGEPDRTQADIRKIQKALHWSPKVSFEEGVKKVLANINYWKGAPVWTPGTIKKATREWFKYLKGTG